MANMVQKFEGNQNVLNTLKILNNEQDDVLRKREEQIMGLKRDVKRNKQQCKLKEVEVTKKQHDLAKARQAAAVLHNFISVLEHRITELEEREQPTQQFLNNLKKTIEKMNGACVCVCVFVSVLMLSYHVNASVIMHI
jgi:chromosome segregation ATPase